MLLLILRRFHVLDNDIYLCNIGLDYYGVNQSDMRVSEWPWKGAHFII